MQDLRAHGAERNFRFSIFEFDFGVSWSITEFSHLVLTICARKLGLKPADHPQRIEIRKSKFENRKSKIRGRVFNHPSCIYRGWWCSRLPYGRPGCCSADAFGQVSWWFPVCQLVPAGGLGFCPEWYVAPAPVWGGVREVSLWLLKLHGYCDCLIVHELHVLTGGLRLDIAFKGLFQVRLAGVKW